MAKGICSIEGCDRPHYAHGWCSKHYQQRRYLSEAGGHTARTCSVPDCGQPYSARGLCAQHYARQRTRRQTAARRERYTTPPSLPGEEWRPVVGFEGCYEVSSLGRVRSLNRPHHPGRVLKQVMNSNGRLTAHLSMNGIIYPQKQVHVLVLTAFAGPRPAPEAHGCHNDGKPTNNRFDNLRWDSASGNMQDKKLHGTDHHANKVVCKRKHLLMPPNLKASQARKGHRACLACSRATSFARTRLRRGHDPIDIQVEADRRYAWIMGHERPSPLARGEYPLPR